MIQARYTRYPLKFIRPATTSRGTLPVKSCWYLCLTGEDGRHGLGEVAFMPHLSRESPGRIEQELERLCKRINRGEADPGKEVPGLPGIRFALETALKSMELGGSGILFPSEFTEGGRGIPINGLIWMGDRQYLMHQIREKVELGFRVIKMKVGALAPDVELEVMAWIRSEFSGKELEIRLDANGAWTPEEAGERMGRFAVYGIHSVEQPLPPGNIEAMAELCRDPAIPVALDEELLGVDAVRDGERLLGLIRPAHIILKPGLLGGFTVARQWIDAAETTGTGWWITSALESSVGLNAIAQWTAMLNVTIPQGLGTGTLYSNNIPSPLSLEHESIWYRPERGWDFSAVFNP